MILIKSNNKLITVKNPKCIFCRNGELTIRTKDGKEYKGTYVGYE